jgi:CPA2 family monovalent cation:H+ antiporter-2
VNAPIDLSVYKETLLFLATAGVIAPLFFRLHVSPVLGYLLAGLALGPYGLGSLDLKAPWLNALAINVEAIDRIAAFGVVGSCSPWGSNCRSNDCAACADWCSGSGWRRSS